MPYKLIADREKDVVIVRNVEAGTETVFPRHLPWAEVDKLPEPVLRSLNVWSNAVEYRDSSYLSQEVITHDTLPTWLGGMAASFGISKDERILDYGTGMGSMRLGFLRDGFKNTFGADISKDCLLRQSEWSVKLGLSSQKEKMNNLLTIEELQNNIGVFIGSFAMIVASSLVHHMADLPGFIQTCRMLLRPGGRLVAFNEPINKIKWHVLAGNPTVIDLFDFTGPEGMRPTRKTPSTTMFAEVWDAQGFDKAEFERMLGEAQFRLVDWNPGMWLSYLCHHLARNGLSRPGDADQEKEFADIYEQVLQLDNRLRPLLRDEFQQQNFFTVSMVAEAC